VSRVRDHEVVRLGLAAPAADKAYVSWHRAASSSPNTLKGHRGVIVDNFRYRTDAAGLEWSRASTSQC